MTRSVNRIRKRKLLRKLRGNMRAMGHQAVDKLSAAELLAMAGGDGSLEEAVLLTDPKVAPALERFAARQHAGGKVPVGPDEVEVVLQKGSNQTHDEAGELVTLVGGPMDGWHVREGAPALDPGWAKEGRYALIDITSHGDASPKLVAQWTPR